ncbi:MAG TPA: hypothetical protein V6D27_07730, partial [Vampirovibrionales bacterium]
ALSAIAFGIGSLPWTQAAQEAAIASSLLGALIGAYAGLGAEELISRLRGMGTARDFSQTLAGAIAGGICGAWPIVDASRSLSNGWAWLGWMGLSILTGIVAGAVFDELEQGKIGSFSPKIQLKISPIPPYFARGIAVLTVGLGISLGFALNEGIFAHYWVSLLILGTAIPLGKMLYPHWVRSRQVREYHESKAKRIQP